MKMVCRSDKRVLIVTNLFPSKSFPYRGTFVRGVSDGLSTLGWSIDLCILKVDLRQPFRYLKYFIETFYKVNNAGGIVYLHYVGIAAIPALLAVMLNSKIRLVTNFHGSDGIPGENEGSLAKWVKGILSKLAVRYSRLLVFPSSSYKAKMEIRYRKVALNQSFVSPSGGVCSNIFYPGERKKQYDFVFASRMVPGKGVITAIKSLNLALGSSCNFSSIFVGDGPERRELLTYVDNSQISDKIYCVGFCEQRELGEIFRKSRFLLFPFDNDNESLGLVLVEAIYCGCIPIVLDRGAVRELIPRELTEILVAIDEADYIDKLRFLYHLPIDRLSCISESLQKYTSKFDRRATIEVLSDCLAAVTRSNC